MGKTEEWKPVVGYEDFYEVSDWGRVKSLNYRNTGKEGIMKPSPDGDGYLHVDLSKNGEKEKFLVHILVMRAFIGKCPDGHEIDHYDWNPSNNRLENLSYQPKEVNRGRKSPEWYKKNAEAAKRRAADPEWQKSQAEGCRKRSQNQEWQKNNAEAAKKRAADPEWLQNVAEANRRKAQDPNWRKHHSEAIQKRSENSNWRKNQAEATRKALSKTVDQYNLDGTFVKRWSSTREAARELGVNQQSISKCCNGKRNKTGGFIWRYAQ